MTLYYAFLIGILIGTVITRILTRPNHPTGTIVIDRSDPDGPHIFLESYVSIDSLSTRKKVLLKVEQRDYISQR